eukprot:CAMPEP_0174252282 /NCGR_PEP_ID=MMETSP0439-20130205/1821_1 /TAXON_ID=0 /ORGANISM="Stereomyxa ramosa, Strain Chinc5" /LENGTH=246 /DNA_ID=CAMNT_0015332797 /DNA_START=95 /DNA_END=832 /DNA_ORIENTATION=+
MGSDLEGLLFGTIKHEVMKSFEDTQAQDAKKGKTTFAIHSFFPIGPGYSLYDYSSEVKANEIQEKAKLSKDPLIGWFRFRRNSPLRPSMREVEVHKNLNEFYSQFAQQTGRPQFPFLFGLFTGETTPNNSIHTYDYRFMQIDEKSQTTPMSYEIINLVNSPQEEYDSFSALSPIPTSEGFGDIFSTSSPQVRMLDSYFHNCLEDLEAVSLKLYEDSCTINKLQQEISELEKKRTDATLNKYTVNKN